MTNSEELAIRRMEKTSGGGFGGGDRREAKESESGGQVSSLVTEKCAYKGNKNCIALQRSLLKLCRVFAQTSRDKCGADDIRNTFVCSVA